MNSKIRKLAFCAFLGASGSALAAPVLIPNGNFESGSTNWRFDQANGYTVSYPTTGGNSGGFAQINGSAATAASFAVLVNPATTTAPANFISLSSLGLTAGQNYTFSQDMRIFSGTSIGGLKLEWREGGGTAELFPTKIGSGATWETYNFTILIPSGVTGIKFVPLWGANSTVGYDNVRVDNGAVPLVPGIPNPGFEIPNGATWAQVAGGTTNYSYPTTGGNPGGYGIMTNVTEWGIWVANNNSPLTLGQLSLTAGQTYNFRMDMKLLSGTNLGKFKIDWVGGTGGSTGELDATMIGNGASWATYTFPITIPLGATALKIVPVAGRNSSVGFDNISVNSTSVAPVPDPIVNGDFSIPNGSGWATETTNPTITFPATGGNPGGCAIIDASMAEGFAAIKAFSGNAKSFALLGLTPGQTATIQMDMKILAGSNIGGVRLVGTEGFVILNRPAVIGNGTEWATYSIPFTVPTNPTAAEFTFVWGFNSKVAFDNIKIVLPGPDQPLQATITQGALLSWTAASAIDGYQPQSSSNGTTWTNLGPVIIGNSATSVFDTPRANFYQVLRSTATSNDSVFNGGFETEFISPQNADGWEYPPGQSSERITTPGAARTGTACMQLAVDTGTESSPKESQTSQNVKNATEDGSGIFKPIVPGTSYTLSFWYSQISSGPGYVQEYRVSWLGLNGAEIPAGGGQWQNLPSTGGTTYTERILPGLVAPAGALSAFIQITGKTGAAPGQFGKVNIDDVTLISAGFTNTVVIPSTSIASVEISWPSKTGKSYQVQSSNNLGSWSSFGSVITGNGSLKAVYDSMVIPKNFYRVGVLP